MTSLATLLILTIVLIVVLSKSIKIAGESERFAVFLLGRFQGFMGPGLVLVTPFTQKVIRLKVGDIGVFKGPGFVTFDEFDIPTDDANDFRAGQPVRIERFDGSKPVFAASSIAAQTLCPNCGHRF